MNVEKRIFDIQNEKEFLNISLDVFHLQYQNCKVYHNFVNNLNLEVSQVKELVQIPYLPIEFFKNNIIISGENKFEKIFLSSGTTGQTQSKHYIKDISIYEKSFINGFNLFYGDIEKYCVLALLPSYLERDGSSLVYMVDKLIKLSKNNDSGFYLYNENELIEKLKSLKSRNQKCILIGVTFALLDIAEKYNLDLNDVIIMETGGMKGRKEEIIRDELHEILTESFNVSKIHSEYGMTELLSQAYSKFDGIFNCPPWMKVLVREVNDPLNVGLIEKTGGLNIIDLANINSCSFIATQDLGIKSKDESFKVSGRFDYSDIRGCNLLTKFNLIILIFVIGLCSIFSNNVSAQVKSVSDNQFLKNKKFINDQYNTRTPKFLFANKNNLILKYNPISLILGSLMFSYQKLLSPQISAGCLYSPTCSEFSRQLIFRYGIFKGVFLSADRLMRCNQFAISDLPHVRFDEKDNRIHESTDMFKLH